MKTALLFLSRVLALVSLLPMARGATVTWDGGGGNNAWENPANWSANLLPTSADDVVITGTGEIIYSTGSATVRSLQSSRGFTLAGGTFTLTTGSSSVTGVLKLNGGTLIVRGATASFSASNASHNGSSLSARDGGTIDLPALATLLRESSGYVTLSAHGAGSRISLPALEQTTVSEYYALELEALDGGTIEAPAFSAFTGGR